ncbi:aldo/keto reductase [Pseudoroseomonas globiformis]|uniref:Aldo/keto reductase n=1 Tax=Teichococcus globiformis TaxID=2307229 RepID=A0ABV7G355_9PROT
MTLPPVFLGQRSNLRVSAIGLGCSRLGSTLSGCTGPVAEKLLHHALDAGVTLLDTANIYGQGESERLIGRAIHGRRDEVTLVTKAGQRFTAAQRVVALAKSPLRMLAQRVPSLRAAIANRRAGALPRDFSPGHVQSSVEASLRRLGTDRIDLFLLHSPDAEAIRRGETFTMLDGLVRAGKLRAWGISVDDVASAEAALAVPSVAALQIPLAVAREMRPALEAGAAQGIGFMMREIFTGAATQPGGRAAAIHASLFFPQAMALVGTTSSAHLDEALGHLRGTPIPETTV